MTGFIVAAPMRLAVATAAAMSASSSVVTGPPAATGFTLSGSTTGTTGTPATFAVTPNGVLSATVTVTPTATNAGSVSPTTLTFSAGTSSSQTFTVTRTTDGTSSISITNSGGLSNLGTPIGYTTTSAAPALTSFSLTSPTGGTNVPFVIGQAFRQGDVSSAAALGGDSALQIVPRTFWPDGSLRFAYVCGRKTLSAGTPSTVLVQNSGAIASGTALAIADLKATGITASIAFGAFGTSSWATTDWDTPFQTLYTGPVCSSWTYRKPIGTDAHLVAWLEVRLYAGGAVEVLPWVENGYLKVASPTSKTAVASFTLGGTQRYSSGTAIALLHHNRAVLASGWPVTHWLGTDPQVTPKHDTAYLMATKAVPNYFASTSAGSTLWARQVTSYTPLAQAQYHDPWGDTGFQAHIGLLPEWDAAYLTSGGDARAYKAVVVNALAAGRYGHHYRDETTNRPLKFSSYPTLVTNDSGVNNAGASTISDYTPTAGGATPPQWDGPHHPSIGYVAHLVTGWNYFMEECQFIACMNYLRATDGGSFANRGGSAGIMRSEAGWNIPRGFAWSVRSLAQAVAITPTTDSIYADLQNSFDQNVQYYWNRYVNTASNPLGLVQPFDHYNDNTASLPWQHSTFMYDFCCMAVGYAKDLSVASATFTAKLDAFAQWQYRSVVGRLQSGKGGTWNYRYAESQFTRNIAPRNDADYGTGAGPWYADWNAASAANSIPAADGGNTLQGISGSDPGEMATGFWGNLLPALAYAVDHGYPGADTAFWRLRGSSSFTSFISTFNDTPVWAVAPRLASMSLPSWLSSATLNTWTQIPGTNLSSVNPTPQPPGATGPSAKIAAWCGGALKRRGSVYYIGAAGGHTDYAGNEVDAITLNTAAPSWRQVVSPSPASQCINASQFFLDLRPSPTHTYYAAQYLDSKEWFVVMPSPGMGTTALPNPPAGWPYTDSSSIDPSTPNGGGKYMFVYPTTSADWKRPTDADYPPLYAGGGDFTSCIVAKNPWTDDVYYSRSNSNGWWRYRASDNTFVRLSGTTRGPWYTASAVDPVRNRILCVGSWPSDNLAPFVTDFNGTTIPVTFGGLGSAVLRGANYNAVMYDEVRDVFVVIMNGATTVYEVDPVTWNVTNATPSGVPPAVRDNGWHNGPQYVPELRGWVTTITHTGNMYFVRTAA